MRAMVLGQVGSFGKNDEPLHLVDLPIPIPGTGELLIEVGACGVCHTELDEIEGRARPPGLPVVPGPQGDRIDVPPPPATAGAAD